MLTWHCVDLMGFWYCSNQSNAQASEDQLDTDRFMIFDDSLIFHQEAFYYSHPVSFWEQPLNLSFTHIKRKQRILPNSGQTWRNHLRPASPRVCLLSDKDFHLDWPCQGVGGHPWSSLSFNRPTVTRLSVTTNINAFLICTLGFISFLSGIGNPSSMLLDSCYWAQNCFSYMNMMWYSTCPVSSPFWFFLGIRSQTPLASCLRQSDSR
jgi:hypothetical protein